MRGSLIATAIALTFVQTAAAQRDDTDTRMRENTDSERKTWWVHASAVNAYPNMDSEALIHELFEPAMSTLAPGFDGVHTVGELRDNHLLWTPQIGVGHRMGRRWEWEFEFGGLGGKVRTKSDDPSIVFGAPLHVDFEIERSAYYTGVGLSYLPFGPPARRRFEDWRERLKAARPSLQAGLNLTYATYDAKVKVGLGGLPNFVNVALSDRWLIPSFSLGAGIEIPVNDRSAIAVSGSRNWFAEQSFDFNSWAYTFSYRFYFK